MHLDDRRISVSLTTVVFKPAWEGTKLIFTEQAREGREEGTAAGMGSLGRYLGR